MTSAEDKQAKRKVNKDKYNTDLLLARALLLMNKLKAEVSFLEPDAVLIDGCGMQHELHWATDGLVKDLVDGAEKYMRKIFLIVDRYMPDSIKSDTTDARVGAFWRSHQLSLNMELPPKDMCLYSTTTKQNLIDLVSG